MRHVWEDHRSSKIKERKKEKSSLKIKFKKENRCFFCFVFPSVMKKAT